MLPTFASVNIDLKVVAGMVAWFLSGPLYIPIMVFFCITPTTRNVDWLICTVCPTRSSCAEEVRGQLVAQEDHAALLVEVGLVEEAAARLGDDVAHRAEARVHARGCGALTVLRPRGDAGARVRTRG